VRDRERERERERAREFIFLLPCLKWKEERWMHPAANYTPTPSTQTALVSDGANVRVPFATKKQTGTITYAYLPSRNQAEPGRTGPAPGPEGGGGVVAVDGFATRAATAANASGEPAAGEGASRPRAAASSAVCRSRERRNAAVPHCQAVSPIAK